MRDPQTQEIALIDLSKATRQPEKLAELLTRLATQIKIGEGIEGTLFELDSVAEADHEVTLRLANKLARKYMPKHHRLETLNGERYTNLRDEEPRYMITRSKLGLAVASKVARKANGLPIVYQTGSERPAGNYVVVHELGDVQGIKLLTKKLDDAHRIMDNMLRDSSNAIVKAEEHCGGQTGEYFGDHADAVAERIRVEVQVKDLRSEARQEKDNYHRQGKYSLSGLGTPLAQVELLR